ncbi:hypothetical protein EIN_426050, partial [Entamoeba invadens IP1]
MNPPQPPHFTVLNSSRNCLLPFVDGYKYIPTDSKRIVFKCAIAGCRKRIKVEYQGSAMVNATETGCMKDLPHEHDSTSYYDTLCSLKMKEAAKSINFKNKTTAEIVVDNYVQGSVKRLSACARTIRLEKEIATNPSKIEEITFTEEEMTFLLFRDEDMLILKQ